MTAIVDRAETEDRPGTVAPLAITAVGVVTPVGCSVSELVSAVSTAGSTERAVAPVSVPGPEFGDLPPRELRAADPPATELLGRKGLRGLDRSTLLALSACELTWRDAGGRPDDAELARTGVVLGTNGSVRNSSDYSRETLVNDRPYLVNPGLFPSTVMNCAAGQVAIRNGLRGVNATLAGGALAGLQAFRYARNALAFGHADRLLVGAVEEFSAQAAWGWHNSGAVDLSLAVGEGAAIFALEAEQAARAGGRPVLARVLSCEIGFAADGPLSVTSALTGRLRRALARSGAEAGEVSVVGISNAGQRGVAAAERRALAEVFAGSPRVLDLKPVVGETFHASAALTVAALVGEWRTAPQPSGREFAAVTACSADGNVGAMVLERVVR